MSMIYGWLTAFGIFLILAIGLKFIKRGRLKKAGFPYVFVEEDGRIRKLSKKEVAFISQEFKPNDPNYPFIKQKVKDKKSDGTSAGYMLVTKVPIWKKVDW